MDNLKKEIEKLKKDKEESNDTLRLEALSYAEKMKGYLGEEIKKELLNPTNNTFKKNDKKGWWENLKEKLNNYFFSINNETYKNE